MNIKSAIPLDSELMQLSVKRAKEMIENLEAGGKESAREFLPIYNRITGRQEKGSCATCWKPRIKLLKQVIAIIEQHELFKGAADTEGEKLEAIKEVKEIVTQPVTVKGDFREVDPPKEEEKPAPPAKKKRGRPKKTNN